MSSTNRMVPSSMLFTHRTTRRQRLANEIMFVLAAGPATIIAIRECISVSDARIHSALGLLLVAKRIRMRKERGAKYPVYSIIW